MSFRARLVLGAAYLLLAVLVALTIPLALNVDRRARSELESDVVANAAVLSARVSDLVAQGNVSGDPPAQVVDRLGQIVSGVTVADRGRTLVVDGRGRVLADSAGTATPGETYATQERPELLAALSQGRVDVRQRRQRDARRGPPPRHRSRRGRRPGRRRPPGLRADGRRGRERPLELAARRPHRARRGRWSASASPGSSPARSPARSRSSARRRRGWGAAISTPASSPRGRGRSTPSDAPSTGWRTPSRRTSRPSATSSRNASHQLRTPLTGIKLRLEAIRAQGGSAAEEAQKAEGELDRLSALVDDLLALARASSLETTGEIVDLGEAARAAGRRWAGPAASAGHELRDRGRQPGARVGRRGRPRADPRQPHRERVRYSPPGTRIVVTAEGAGRPALVVADTGPGIPPEERERVFERFFRGAGGRQWRRARASGSPSSPSSPTAGRERWSSSTGPGPASGPAFPRCLPTPHPRLTDPEECRC